MGAAKAMGTVDAQIHNVDAVICSNIASGGADRALLSQNLLAQLRNLVEAVAVRIHMNNGDAKFAYDGAVKPALAYIRSQGRLSFLSRLHKLLQMSASHYTQDGENSERLMLKYYEYLHRTRSLLADSYGINVLANLEDFPVDLDPSLREYHERIAARIEIVGSYARERGRRDRYYIQKVKPFFVAGTIYYEVTFTKAGDKVSKFDRIIAFTDIDMTDRYAANLTLLNDSIDILGQTMPITIIREWEVSIRPCEFNNFARIFGVTTRVAASSPEYRRLMQYLTERAWSLIDVVELPDDVYEQLKTDVLLRTQRPQIVPVLDAARGVVARRSPGAKGIRYLALRMKNEWLKLQYWPEPCGILSNLMLGYGCNPFDQMPFCTSLQRHNPRLSDLTESIDPAGRTHELLARRVRNNVEQRGMIYMPVAELEEFGDVDPLIKTYNAGLYYKHTHRRLLRYKNHVFLKEYEDHAVAIIEKLQALSSCGVDDYTDDVDTWLDATSLVIDDPDKIQALRGLFGESRVALIYGAAGTGKSTMVNYISHVFDSANKLYLAQTNPAVDNLRRKVTADNATFSTISKQIRRRTPSPAYDLLVIDECSTVSNADLLKVLERTSFDLLVLVGDVYQIEAIQFGNWFGIAPSFLPESAVFELKSPYRTKNPELLKLWGKVRNVDDDIAEVMTWSGYSAVLNESLFEPARDDEIVLCLNYDGLYGINNVNRFLQSSNPNLPVEWGVSTYKVGDPILFNDSERFWPLIHNNQKATIVDITWSPGIIQFDVDLLDLPVTESDVEGLDLRWLHDSTVQFDVYEYASSDDDDDALDTTVPFQVAYAVSIHRAQGLEYDSVKVVVTHDNEDDVSHSIFYTAITRARDQLKIFWTPESQQKVLSGLEHKFNHKDVSLLSTRRGLTARW